MSKSNCFLLILSLATLGCGYTKDELKIYNKSSNDICYETLVKDELDKTFHEISGGGCIKSKEINSPPVRGSIEYNIRNEPSFEKALYIVYYNKKDASYVTQNPNLIIRNKKFKTEKYTLESLKRGQWRIVYNGR